MDISLSEIKDLVAISKPFIDPLISAFIQPKIEKLAKFLKRKEIENEVIGNYFENKFEEYIARTYNKCQNINILIFPNQQIKLKEIFFPLTIQSTKDNKDYNTENFNLDILEKYKKMLISDTAGMGKSTIMKWIGIKLIENSLAIPILIELRNLKEGYSILDEIFNQINPIDKSFDKDLILKFLELGNFVVLLDGFDEIQLKNQELIIRDIRDFISKTSKNHYILTSRPEGSLASFGDFQSFNIKPLKSNEAFQLIKKYDNICSFNISDKLIDEINKNFEQTRELLENPFLVSLLYSTYTYNKDIPSNKITFYDEIYSALFKRHDLSKDGWSRPKKSNLDIQHFKIILRQLAFDTAVIGTIVYSETEILHYINNAKQKSPGIIFNDSDFLEDILSAVPLFQRDGSKIKWSHKSLQDYFAADFIAFDSRKEDIIKRIFDSKKDSFLNILEFFFELDYKTFRKIIILNLLEDFLAYSQDNYKNFPDIPQKVLRERISKTFEINAKLISNTKKPLGSYLTPENSNDFFVAVTHKVILAFSNNLKVRLINLLINKNLPFFTYQAVKKTFEIKLRFEGYLLVNDKIDSVFNSKRNFKKINDILQYPFKVRGSNKIGIFDFNKVSIELQSIKNEIAKEKNNDDFKDI